MMETTKNAVISLKNILFANGTKDGDILFYSVNWFVIMVGSTFDIYLNLLL